MRKTGLLFLVLAIIWGGILLLGYISADNFAIQTVIAFSNLMMAIFVAIQTDAVGRTIQESTKQTKLTNKYLLETQKQRLRIEEIKDLLFSYLDLIITLASDSQNRGAYASRFPEPEHHVRKGVILVGHGITQVEVGFGARAAKYIKTFLECRGIIELLNTHNELADKFHSSEIQPEERERYLEKLRKSADTLADKAQEILSLPDKELEDILLKIILEGKCN